MKNGLNHDDIRYIVKRVLRNYQMSGRDSASRAIATEVHDAIERTYEMNKSRNLAHDFPIEMEKHVRRFEKALETPLLRTSESLKIYEWILEQEREGRKFEQFAAWAKSPERKQWKPKYYSKPEYIQVDYSQAFDAPTQRTSLLETI